MSSIMPYGLAANFCEECGKPKTYRLHEVLTGCKTCDEVITRHRCTGRPHIDDLPDGQTWECADCGTRWTPRSAEEECWDCCAECGHRVTVRRWDRETGGRLNTAPRYEPQGWTPFRNRIPRTTRCYRAHAGFMVHVTPGCRCPK